MDYLKLEFHEALKDGDNCYVQDGRIFIGGKHWAPEDVLNQMSKDTYKGVFDEWIDLRKENLIQIADDILDDFEQRERFERLKQSFSKNSVVPFIGAGISHASGYPLWTVFLKKLAQLTDITFEELDAKLIAGKYEEAAQDIADELGPEFSERIESAFGDKKEIKGVVQLLPALFDCPVVTTNYDSLLKRCYDAQNIHFDEVISGHQAIELSKFLASGDRVLIKLHGTAMSGLGRILTLNEYQTNYENNGVIGTVINSLCSKTLLFIGCSLSFDRTIKAIETYVKDKGHENVPRHYAFLKAPFTQEAMNEKSRVLTNANIFPIWYAGGDHDQAVEALLQKLGE
jgi:hypothetical protein